MAALSLLVAVNPPRTLVSSARRFVRYYRALESSELRGHPWEKALVSLMLASTYEPPSRCAGVRI